MNQHTRLARHFASLQALGFVTVLAACGGGGGVSVPDGVVVNPGPAAAPPAGTPPPPPPPPPPAPNPSASTCVDPAPTVTQTAGFDAATVPANTGTAVSANGGTVCFSASTTGAVRSNTAISQGNFYYFEATRSNSVSIGVGTAAAPLAPTGAVTSGIASTAQSILITDGTVFTKGAFIPNFNVGAETKFGIAVDYRGLHPVVYVLGSTQAGSAVSSAASNCSGSNVTIDAATPCVYGRHVLGSVTDPVYIYASGNNSNAAQTGKVSINTGGNAATKAFTYGAMKVRQAVRTVAFKGEVGLNAQWAGTTAIPVTPLPTIIAASRTRSIVKTNDGATPYTPSFSVTTAAGTSVQWLSDTNAILGSTATLSLTDTDVQSAITAGTHRLQAVVRDNTTEKLNALDFMVTLTTTDLDDDGDGRTYLQEQAAGTDPANPDTDGDGIADGVALSPTTGSQVVLQRETGVSGLATSQGVVMDDDKLTIVLNSDVNPDCTDGTLPAAGNFGTQPLSEEQCKKRAIRASIGVQPGEFRYYETRRAVDSGFSGFNMGQGFITRTGKIDPFCCTAAGAPDPRTPPSFMANSADGFWDSLVSIASFGAPTNTTVIGFAVDYTNPAAPVVHAITSNVSGSPAVFSRTISGFAGGEAVPFIYGHPYSNTLPAMEINFGLKAFTYDARAVLTTAAVPNVGSLVLGVGIHRRP